MAMKRMLVPACCLGAVGAAPPSDDQIETMWARFKTDYPKNYASEASRFVAFKSNVLLAQSMNEDQGATCTDLFDGEDCVFGITKFSDMFEDEFAKTKLGYTPRTGPSDATVLDVQQLGAAPTSVDWRTKGAVSPVKDQGQCGSCWAFSTTEEIESQMFMKTGKLPILSTQQIISCDKVDGGCDGGNTETAYAYVKKAGGLATAKDYPDKSHTTAKNGKCKWDKTEAAKVTGYTYATKECTSGACKNQDEDALAVALASKGPVSICVNAGGNGWQVYKKGIFKAKCSGAAADLDHCVQLVGYDKSGATPYWIVRNSWNTDWGIDGYMHLKMGSNLCGVADDATIAQVTAGSEFVTV